MVMHLYKQGMVITFHVGEKQNAQSSQHEGYISHMRVENLEPNIVKTFNASSNKYCDVLVFFFIINNNKYASQIIVISSNPIAVRANKVT